jgi:pSer/pThr/pTyr-binding forkhead associated (FHA) protein
MITGIHQGAFVAKLTLSFKDRKLKVFALQSGDCVIGRDPTCTIAIDSLAVEPEHARIRSEGDDFVVEAVHAGCALSVNQQPVEGAQTLHAGDNIQIGKHSLNFSEDSEETAPAATVSQIPAVGWLQIQSGAHMGRTIRLDRAFTRVGKPDSELAVIAHRDDGYYLSVLQGKQGLRVNDEDVADSTHKLSNGDRIVIGELQVQFFADIQAAQSSGAPETAPGSGKQRRFSRIPFDVSATLKDEQHSWETSLLDISLQDTRRFRNRVCTVLPARRAPGGWPGHLYGRGSRSPGKR